MPTFKCTYRDDQGRLVTDIKTARDSGIIKKEIRQKNYYPISIEDVSSARRQFSLNFFFSKNRELAVFTRQLSSLLSTGTDLSRALGLLGRYTKHPLMKNVSVEAGDRVSAGGHFWEGLTAFPKIFSPLYIGMVRAGETAGHLESVIGHLADYTEEQKETKDTLVSMAIYPMFLFFVGGAVLLFIMGFVFPRMLFIFDGFQGGPLPLTTRMLISISTFLSVHGWIIALLCMGVAMGIYRCHKNPAVRLIWHSWVYRLPIVGETVQKIIFVRFTRILGLVLSNGMAMVDALEISRNVIDNSYVAAKLAVVKRNVFQGRSLSEGLMQEGIFPPLMVHIIAIGEETGALDKTLADVSRSYDREVKEEMRRFMNMLEPAIILVIALGVGFIVLGTLLPIFQMDLLSL